ncbi:hypothetical protein E9549_15015 [Blastococcus sp. MG754426]|uniref:hypothetical protein n=1 Tax=unclassified Blastococcus TaxID=2619396 RepID=UPI001EF07374|nr:MULTISPECIES: hypothetical protein [unclassified Blastococcus]MCF6508705.1 hypothetical protein [Blastococcus sp. MG754426]MCF6513314.1 hypothetical protein [Blastococcus sp. MG754427]MCF6734071.1 hypothetical protein [Blastococcus sp. KM273129]
MSTLQAHLDDLAATPPVRSLAEALAARTAIESDRTGTYVSLRPSLSGAIAVYAHRNRISIGLPPERAAEVVARFPGAKQEEKGPTTYLQLSDELLANHATAVMDLAVEAVTWKAAGPASTLGGHAKQSEKAPQICPEHWYALSPAGACPVCG